MQVREIKLSDSTLTLVKPVDERVGRHDWPQAALREPVRAHRGLEVLRSEQNGASVVAQSLQIDRPKLNVAYLNMQFKHLGELSDVLRVGLGLSRITSSWAVSLSGREGREPRTPRLPTTADRVGAATVHSSTVKSRHDHPWT